MGRIWEIGPQQTLYMPGCWLKKGDNEILVFDILGPREARSEGFRKPVIDKLLVNKPSDHMRPGFSPDLKGAVEVLKSSFNAGNGWQERTFDRQGTGRYVILEAIDAIDGGDNAAIAELYLLDAAGKRISREPWTVDYADSEQIDGVNRTADKTYDLQESTYWSTAKGVRFPHRIVIDLGRRHTLSAIQCLPRMEAGAPGAIRNFKVYMTDRMEYVED